MHIYTTFLFNKLNIYTHQTRNKKSLVILIKKLCLVAILHKIKFIFTIFIVKVLKIFIFNTNYQILY